jgi:hypothetical protein
LRQRWVFTDQPFLPVGSLCVFMNRIWDQDQIADLTVGMLPTGQNNYVQDARWVLPADLAAGHVCHPEWLATGEPYPNDLPPTVYDADGWPQCCPRMPAPIAGAAVDTGADHGYPTAPTAGAAVDIILINPFTVGVTAGAVVDLGAEFVGVTAGAVVDILIAHPLTVGVTAGAVVDLGAEFVGVTAGAAVDLGAEFVGVTAGAAVDTLPTELGPYNINCSLAGDMLPWAWYFIDGSQWVMGGAWIKFTVAAGEFFRVQVGEEDIFFGDTLSVYWGSCADLHLLGTINDNACHFWVLPTDETIYLHWTFDIISPGDHNFRWGHGTCIDPWE